MTETADPDVVAEFERAWDAPQHTRAVQPEIDINRVLHERYETTEPLNFTRSMLWDVEKRKAAAPGTYIPFVVRHGTDRSWARRALAGGAESLKRCSQQRMWLHPDNYGLVLERAYLDHHHQKVTFTGEGRLTDPDGRDLQATTLQRRFHVEHAVGGSEEAPLNLWRIVHLTDQEDRQLIDQFSRMGQSPWLPDFVEIYIRHDLNIGLTRAQA